MTFYYAVLSFFIVETVSVTDIPLFMPWRHTSRHRRVKSDHVKDAT